MTTTKVLASTNSHDDMNYMTGKSAVSLSALVAASVTTAAVMVQLPALAVVLHAVFSFLAIFGVCMFVNRGYVRDRVEFLHSISAAVEKETGHALNPKHVFQLLFSGKSRSIKGSSLSVSRTDKEMRVLLSS